MRPLNTRVPEPLYAWLEEEAKSEGMTVSELLRYLLLGIKRRGEK